MQTFIGTKLISARPMNRRDYNRYRDWDLPANENGDDEGFLVEYIDGGATNDDRHTGYISWSPVDVFHAAYQITSRMNFGHAIEMLKRGEAVARAGWNGKRMFLYLVPAPEQGYPAQTGVAKAFFGEGALVPYGAYIAMKTATGEVVPWLASQTDMLADDWTVVRIEELKPE
jgi:hypothetical protein